jgi:hypothetical protein
MLGTLLFNLITVFFAWLESARIFKHGLKFAVFVYVFSPYQMLVLSSAMRQAVG